MNILSEGLKRLNLEKDVGQSLSQDLHVFLEDVQSLLQATASQGGDTLDELRTNLASSVESVKQSLQESEDRLLAQSKAAIKATDNYVHEHPWQSAGLAAALGFALAWTVKRSNSR